MRRYARIAALALLAPALVACRGEQGRSVGIAEQLPDAGPELAIPTSPVQSVGACPAITPCIKNCDLGDSDACVRAGNFRWRGHRSEGDGRTELDFFRMACDAGDADGCRFLAFKYEGGEGVPPDAGKANELLRKAA
jgi:TPR repeat protein